MTNINGGLAVDGYPVGLVGGLAGVPDAVPGGRVLYVRSGGGLGTSAYGDGTDVDAPLSSVFSAGGAFEKIAGRAGRGDTVFVLPGHAENVSAADMGALMTTASGFRLLGLGWGNMRPSFTWTTAAATLLFDTDNVVWANTRMFLAGAHSAGSALTVAAPVTVSGNGCMMLNNQIWWGFDADQIVTDGITVTGDDFVFRGNWCFGETAAAAGNAFMLLTGADRAVITDNWIKGTTDGTTRGVVYGATTASLDVEVARNYMANMLVASTIAFSPLAGSTPTVAYNRFFVNTGILPITANIGAWHENYCCDTAGQTGALVGTASS